MTTPISRRVILNDFVRSSVSLSGLIDAIETETVFTPEQRAEMNAAQRAIPAEGASYESWIRWCRCDGDGYEFRNGGRAWNALGSLQNVAECETWQQRRARMIRDGRF